MNMKNDNVQKHAMSTHCSNELLSFTARMTVSIETANSAAFVFEVMRIIDSINTETPEKMRTLTKGNTSIRCTGMSKYRSIMYVSTAELLTVSSILMKSSA